MSLETAMEIVGVRNAADPFPTNSKMPGPSFDLPASACRRGSELAAHPTSMCNQKNCYAKRGFFLFPNVREAQARRLAAISSPGWVEAFVTILRLRYPTVTYFRWHASGDLQSFDHLMNIMSVAAACPGIRFWLPTHEHALISQIKPEWVPTNLMIRLSADLISQPAPRSWPFTSTVHSVYGDPPPGSVECRSHDRDNSCGTCRACWNPRASSVSYPRTNSAGVAGTGIRPRQLRIFQ